MFKGIVDGMAEKTELKKPSEAEAKAEEKPLEKKPKPKPKEKPEEKKEEKIDLRVKRIVRIAATDLNGDLSVERAIRGVKGIGFALARAIAMVGGFEKKLGDLTKEEKEKLEAIIREPKKFGIPSWMLNAREEEGHYVSSALELKVKKDIDFMKMIRSYKGVRHQYGLTVRGQRTRSSFRKGAKVGVTRKKEMPKRAATEERERKKKR